MKRFRPWIVAVVLCGLIVGAGYGARYMRSVQNAVDLPMAPAREGEFQVMVQCRGDLVARTSIQIGAPQVPNLVIVWTAPAGSPVKAGQAIIRFDGSSAERTLRENEAALQQANATLDQAKAEARINAEQDHRDLAAAKYAVEKARLEVSKAEIVSALQAEESKINLGLSEEKLNVQAATNEMHAASDAAKIASAQRLKEKAQAEVDLMKERLSHMELKSPIDGIIVFLNNNSQGWMNAKPFKVGDNVWPGSSIAEIPDLTTLELKGKVDEIDRSRMKAGQDVRVAVDAFPEKPFPAQIVAISDLVEQSFEWPPTRSFRAYAKLKQSDERLRPGMNGRMDVILDRIPKAISVPAKALFTKNGKPVVYVVEKNAYRPQEVEVLARNSDEIAIKGIAAKTLVALAEPEEKR
ncbi:MAG: efflux RND transporter periplasmic adaptor subunit [Bryobacteraceae bacterium]